MTTNSFNTYTKENKYEVNKNIAYGMENGYLVTFCQNRHDKLFVFPLPSITEEEKVKLLDFLKTMEKDLCLFHSKFDNAVLIIKVKEQNSQIGTDLIKKIFATVTTYLKENHICLDKHCIFCGNDKADSKIRLLHVEYYMHQACHDKALQGIKEEENSKKDLGFLGAFLGVLLLGIIWILFYEKGLLASCAMFFSGSFAVKFYQVFHGKFHKYTPHLLSLAIFLVLLISVSFILIRSGVTPQKLFAEENKVLLSYISFGCAIAFMGLLVLLLRLNRIEKGRR